MARGPGGAPCSSCHRSAHRRDPHRTRHSAQPDTVQPPVQPLSTHRDITYRFPQYMFSLPPQRTQHIPHGLLYLASSRTASDPRGFGTRAVHGLSICIIRSSPSLLSFYLSSFAAAARWSMYSSALSYTSSHSSSFAHCWQKAITWVGFGFRCSRLIPTLRLGFGSGGQQV